MPRNKLRHTRIDNCKQNRFPDQTHLSALSEWKSSHQKPERSAVQTPTDSPDIGPHINPDTAFEPGKHFLCNVQSQTACFENTKSVIRTK